MYSDSWPSRLSIYIYLQPSGKRKRKKIGLDEDGRGKSRNGTHGPHKTNRKAAQAEAVEDHPGGQSGQAPEKQFRR